MTFLAGFISVLINDGHGQNLVGKLEVKSFFCLLLLGLPAWLWVQREKVANDQKLRCQLQNGKGRVRGGQQGDRTGERESRERWA